MTGDEPRISPLFSEQVVAQAVDTLARGIAGAVGNGPVTAVAVMDGGLWLGGRLLSHPGLADCVSAIHEVKATRTLSDGVMGPPEIDAAFESDVLDDLSGADVLIVDDIFDEGRTLQALAEMISPVAASLRSAVLVMRDRGAGALPPPDHVGLVTDTTGWLVGCGMDSEGRFRNLPYIGVIHDVQIGGPGEPGGPA